MQVIRVKHLEWAINALDAAANWVCISCVAVSILPFSCEPPICSLCREQLWTKTQMLDSIVDGTLISFSNTGLMYYEAAIVHASN